MNKLNFLLVGNSFVNWEESERLFISEVKRNKLLTYETVTYLTSSIYRNEPIRIKPDNKQQIDFCDIDITGKYVKR